MSKKNSRGKSPSPTPAPSVDRPGGELPAEITNPTAGKTAAERFNDWEEGKILDLLKSEFGGTGFVTLQRRHMSVAQGQWTNLAATIPVENLQGGGINLIASMFGGGDYRAKARPSNGQFAREFTFVIDHTIPPKNPLNPGERKEEKAPDLAGIVRTIVDATKPPPQDNALLLAMMTQQTEMMKSAMARPDPKPDHGLASAFESVVKLVDKIAGRMERIEERLNQPAKVLSLREQLEELDALDEFRGRGNGGSEKEKPWYADVAVELAKSAGPFLNKFAGGAPALTDAPQLVAASAVIAPPASSLPLNVTGTGTDAAGNPATNSEDPAMNPILNIALNSFAASAVKAAKLAKDPYELVSQSLGFVETSFPQYLTPIRATANSADWFTAIFARNAEAPKFLPFLVEVRAAVLMNAFVAHAVQFATVKKPAAETVQAFLGWVTPEFHDAFFENTDPDNWAMAFEGAALADGAALDPAWLEELRQAVIAALDLQQTAEQPEPAAAAAAPATIGENGAARSSADATGPRVKAGAAAGGRGKP